MNEDRWSFLTRLVEAPGPSGYEEPVARVWRERVEASADALETDVLGSCFATLNPDARLRVMLSGHIDELGLQVLHVDDKGFLYFNPVGGHDAGLISGRRVLIHTRQGPVPGVTGKRAVHMMSPEERRKVPKVHEIWIDIGASAKEEALELVEIGDPVTYEVGVGRLHGELAVGRAFDDKLGAFVVAEVLRELAERRDELAICVVSVATTQEEIGLRGAGPSAYRARPDVGIAVDVTNPTDYPGTKKEKYGDVRLGKGPSVSRGANLNPILTRRMLDLAADKEIGVQVEAVPGRTGTDAAQMQQTREGVACGLVGIPLRYMHTPCEVVHLGDVERTIDLLVETCLALAPGDDFTPGSGS